MRLRERVSDDFRRSGYDVETQVVNALEKESDERLERLGLDYIDLLLLHHTAANDEHAY